METLHFSFIVPVYNRPEEIKELLESFRALEGNVAYSIYIIEDGSSVTCEEIVAQYKEQLPVHYLFKSNTGPGQTRNYGMQRAEGNYFIILDSDVLLPPHYLSVVAARLSRDYTDCYGGPDAAHFSFSPLQKAIDFAMTSIMTTGGIRGGKASEHFQPRSFNMGISKKAFEASQGFGAIHPGEDPDLSLRLQQLGYRSQLIKEAFVYHKRRISWSKFYQQVFKFGLVRPILNTYHPQSKRLVYWLPSLFLIGFVVSLVGLLAGFPYLFYSYASYFFIAFFVAWFQTGQLGVALRAVGAIAVQFAGYGWGFLKMSLALNLFKQQPEERFPKLFFKHAE